MKFGVVRIALEAVQLLRAPGKARDDRQVATVDHISAARITPGSDQCPQRDQCRNSPPWPNSARLLA